jgi:hypothetical protein
VDPARRKALLDHLADQLGARRFWRLVILSGLALPLLLVVVVILAGVYLSGSATLDDIGLPAVFVVGLTPIALFGLGYGIVGLLGLRKHELLLALRADPPAIARVERMQDGSFVGIRMHLPSGQYYGFWLDPRIVDELGAWLDR